MVPELCRRKRRDLRENITSAERFLYQDKTEVGGQEELSPFRRMFPSPTEMSFHLLWLVFEVNKTDY